MTQQQQQLVRTRFVVKFADTDLCNGTRPRCPGPDTALNRKRWLQSACMNGDYNTLWHLIVEKGMDPALRLPYSVIDDDEDVAAEYMAYVRESPMSMVIRFAVADRKRDYLKCLEILLRAGANPLAEIWSHQANEKSSDAYCFLFETASAIGWKKLIDAEMDLSMLACLLEHTQTAGLPFGDTVADKDEHAMPLDYALRTRHTDPLVTEYECLHAVSMLLETKACCIHTRLGALNTALRDVGSLVICTLLCQKLLAAGVSVNEVSFITSAAENDVEDDALPQDTPLKAAVERLGSDCVELTQMLLHVPHVNPNILLLGPGNTKVTCLLFAAKHPTHARPLLRLLLTHGADPHLQVSEAGPTVLDQIQDCNPEFAALIRDVIRSDTSIMIPPTAKKHKA